MLPCGVAAPVDSLAGVLAAGAAGVASAAGAEFGATGVTLDAAGTELGAVGADGVALGATGTAPDGTVVFSTPGAAGALGTAEKPSITLPPSVGVL